MKQYAPIIVFAFNRLEPLKKLIESILSNHEAHESDLIIFVDGPRPNKVGEAVKVKAVQSFVSQISGFKSIEAHFSKENRGLGPSIIAGVTEVINKYGKVIVLEDDLVVAKGFLCFMNTMLYAYQEDNRIMQIAGFSTVHSVPKGYNYDIYLNRRGESWSWATWADRWNTVDWDVRDYPELLKDKRQQQAFNEIGSDLFGMLKGYMNGTNRSWAVRFCYAMFKQGRYVVAPMKSLVHNEGFNNDATNCKKSFNLYKYEFNDKQISFQSVPNIQYVKSIDKSANRFWSIRYRVYSKILSLFYK